MTRNSLSEKWSALIFKTRIPILVICHSLTSLSARHPKRTVSLILLISFSIMAVGYNTNFVLEVDDDTVWSPRGSRALQHKEWIVAHSGYPEEPRSGILLFHKDGDNVLGYEEVRRVFLALDAVQSMFEYADICSQTTYVNPWTGNIDCRISGITRFFNHSVDIFEATMQSDEDVVNALSKPEYPDGTPVSYDNVFGNYRRDEFGTLVFVQLFQVFIDFPELNEVSDKFEAKFLDLLLEEYRAEWTNDPGSKFRLECQAERSFSDEFERAIAGDLPLLPVVFVIMGIFTAFVFSRRDKVHSRSFLGFNAVISVLLSIIASHGLMFTTGVPYSSLSPLIPFVVFGIGLDDSYIISGCFERTKEESDAFERIHDTIEQCGVSVTLTTMTSATAFGLGCLSSIPTVRWLCIYCFTTIVLVWLFQLTFFVACLVLDENRVKEHRRDCCMCIRVPITESHDGSADKGMWGDKTMNFYTEKLMNPYLRAFLALVFCGLAVASGFSAANLTQEFEFTDVLPQGSYVTDFVVAFETYSVRSSVDPFVYFRWIDHSDTNIQSQMRSYLNELMTIDAITSPPEFFWLDDLDSFVDTNSISELPFEDRVVRFLQDPIYKGLYQDHILLADDGSIATSRVPISMNNIEWENVRQQVDALNDEYAITKKQPINSGKDQWSFFTYDGLYDIWEFYAASVDELIFSTTVGVASVTFLSVIFIPHWTAGFIVLPMICMLYLDLLGFMQIVGLHINALSYIALVLSIGLMVDYLMHILLAYYEAEGTREEKTIHALKTLGTSIMIGGVSTFLGTIPLAFSTSEIFMTVFYIFMGLVLVGIAHGLIFLPVVLASIGPENTTYLKEMRRRCRHNVSTASIDTRT